MMHIMKVRKNMKNPLFFLLLIALWSNIKQERERERGNCWHSSALRQQLLQFVQERKGEKKKRSSID